MAGSILPVHKAFFEVAFYVFTDSTGAEYRLDVNSGSSDLHVFDAGAVFDGDLGEEVYEDDGRWVGKDAEGGDGLQSVAGHRWWRA